VTNFCWLGTQEVVKQAAGSTAWTENGSQHSSVRLRAGWSGVWVPAGAGNFLFSIQWVLGALFLRAKRPGHEADHSPPSCAEVKECIELNLHSPILPHGVVLS